MSRPRPGLIRAALLEIFECAVFAAFVVTVLYVLPLAYEIFR